MTPIKERIFASDNDVIAADPPGNGGAHHRYRITAPNGGTTLCELYFQNGAIKDHGINGIQNEDLLAVVIDRLEGFQSGPYSCDENQYAILSLKSALLMLQNRTRQRIKRGVEGTQAV